MSIQTKIFISIALGFFWGLAANPLGLGNFTIQWIKPFGMIFLKMLKLMAVPLVLVSLVKGISSMNGFGKFSKLGLRTVVLFLSTTILAITIGLVLVTVIAPGDHVSEAKKEEFKAKYVTSTKEKADAAKGLDNKPPLQFLVDLFPENILKSGAENSQMLQIILIATLFGLAIIQVSRDKLGPLLDLLDSLNEVLLKVIDIILLYAPIGVFALMSSLIPEFSNGNLDDTLNLLKALGIYTITVLIGLAIMVYVVYPSYIKILSKANVRAFMQNIVPVQMIAFSTSSSAATLPVSMAQAEHKMGVKREIASFVLPVGATINMDGTSLYQAVAVGFIAQSFGYHMTFMDQLTVILTATLASIGTAPVPGGGLVMLVIVLNSIGIAPEGIALIFAVERIIDMFRTVANVTGDVAVAVILNDTVKLDDDVPVL